MDLTKADRRAVVTGSASGIGQATTRLLRSQGWEVIGADLRDADIAVDLSDPQLRQDAVDLILQRYATGVDAIIACAGISRQNDPAVISTNYFGTTRFLAGLRQLLVSSSCPRAVVVSSFAAVMATDPAILDACLDDDESEALAASRRAIEADRTTNVIYASSKLALAEWVRREAVLQEWAGAGILLNAVAPGTVRTPMMQATLEDPVKAAALLTRVPCPLNRYPEAEEIARLLIFLGSEENNFIVGQTIFIDGGAEASVRRNRAYPVDAYTH